MLIIEVCPGVVQTVGKGPQPAFLEKARRTLDAAGYEEPVLVRSSLSVRWRLWRAWWAVGVSSTGTLTGHPELVGARNRLERRDGVLVIHTDRPGAWIGQGAVRVRALANKWQVRILVTSTSERLSAVTSPQPVTLGGRLALETGSS